MGAGDPVWRGFRRIRLRLRLCPCRRARLLAALCAAVPAVIVAALYLDGRERIFTLDAVTETASLIVSDGAFAEWRIDGAELTDNPLAAEAALTLPQGTYLMLRPGTRVDVQRHGIQDVLLTLHAAAGTAGSIVSPDTGEHRLGAWAALRVPSGGRPLLWPFRGMLEVGDDVTAGVDSVLLQGKVNVLEQQLLRRTRYNAGTSELDRGDRIGFRRESRKGDEAAVVEVFFRIEPANQERFTEALNAIQLIAHGSADYVSVERLGSSGYQIRATRWARFLYDPLLSFLAGVGALLFAAIEIYVNVREILRDATDTQ